MTETRIYELLWAIGRESDCPTTFESGHKLVRKYVNGACKTIADQLYATLKDRSSTATARRTGLIQLVRRCCTKDDGHVSVTADNYVHFLHSFKTPFDLTVEGDVLDEYLCRELESCRDLPLVDAVEDIVDFYKRCDEKHLEKRRFLESMAEFEQTSLYHIDCVTGKKVLCSDSIEKFLAGLLDIPDEEDVISEVRQKERSKCELSTQPKDVEARRDGSVKFACALLNLPKHECTAHLFLSIMAEIAKKGMKSQQEIELIRHAFKSEGDSQFTVDLQRQLVKQFPFLYEIPLIRLCKVLLTTDDPIERASLVERGDCIAIIKMLSASFEIIRSRVMLILYELFAVSDYNENLLTIINYFK